PLPYAGAMNDDILLDALRLGYRDPDDVVAWARNARGIKMTKREVARALATNKQSEPGPADPGPAALTDHDIDQVYSIVRRTGTDAVRVVLDIIDQNSFNKR